MTDLGVKILPPFKWGFSVVLEKLVGEGLAPPEIFKDIR